MSVGHERNRSFSRFVSRRIPNSHFYERKMHLLTHLIVGFSAFLCLIQVCVDGIDILSAPKPIGASRQVKINYRKHSKDQPGWIRMSEFHPEVMGVSKGKDFSGAGKIQRRDIPQQSPVPIQADKESNAGMQAGVEEPSILRVPTAKPFIKSNETEAERAERIHRSFERLLTFVEIVGQVDNYVSSKWKNLVRTVSNFYEVEDEPYHVGAKRLYSACSHTR